jgi:hypothetical protein
MKPNLRLFDRRSTSANPWPLIACLFLFVSSAAFGSEKCGSLDRAANAIRMAQVLYPELRGKEFSLQFSGGSGGILSGPSDARSFLITVDKPQSPPPVKTSERLDATPKSQNGGIEIELPLYLEFGFAEAILGKTGDAVGTKLSCQPLKFMNNKSSKHILEAAEVINAHPEWTDAQDLEAATKLGMQFGPDKKTAVLRLIPLKGLSGFYGPLRIKNIAFSVASKKEPGAYFTDLHWRITVEEIGTSRTLQIAIEPFGGKIDAIGE